MRRKSFVLALVIGAAYWAAASDVVQLVPEKYRTFLQMERAARKALWTNATARAAYAKGVENAPLGVTLDWAGASGGVLKVTQMPQGKTFFEGTIPSNSYTLINLEIARTYAWQVVWPTGVQTGGTFKTADMAPRMIKWPGVPNVRDLGGRIGLNGRRVRQGLVYRSAGLNNNADWGFLTAEELKAAYDAGKLADVLSKTVKGDGKPTDVKHYVEKFTKMFKKGEMPSKKYCDRKFLKPDTAKPGRNRLTPETCAWGLNWLGIKTDLDLRSWREVWGMKESPLGPSVKWINYSSANYDGMKGKFGRDAFTKCFKVFLDKANYPIIFHCIAGADRTGSLACILNGLLGVEEEELFRDWEVTGVTFKDTHFNHADRFDKLIAVFNEYPGDTLNARIEAYVLSCGFTSADIATFRQLMLE